MCHIDSFFYEKMEVLANQFRANHRIDGRVNVDTLKYTIKQMGGSVREMSNSKSFEDLDVLPLNFCGDKFTVNLNISCHECIPPVRKNDEFRWVLNYKLAYLLGVLSSVDLSGESANRIIGKFFKVQDMNNFLFIDCGRFFAESLLMPKHLVENVIGGLLNSRMSFFDMKKDRKIIELAKHFETPVSVVCARLCNLGMISCPIDSK